MANKTLSFEVDVDLDSYDIFRALSDEDLIDELEERGYYISDEDSSDFDESDLPSETLVDDQIHDRLKDILNSAATDKIHFLAYLESYTPYKTQGR